MHCGHVPAFVTAHAFSASRDGQRSFVFLRTVSTKTKIFSVAYDNVAKADLSQQRLLKSKEKMRSNHAFFFR